MWHLTGGFGISHLGHLQGLWCWDGLANPGAPPADVPAAASGSGGCWGGVGVSSTVRLPWGENATPGPLGASVRGKGPESPQLLPPGGLGEVPSLPELPDVSVLESMLLGAFTCFSESVGPSYLSPGALPHRELSPCAQKGHPWASWTGPWPLPASALSRNQP